MKIGNEIQRLTDIIEFRKLTITNVNALTAEVNKPGKFVKIDKNSIELKFVSLKWFERIREWILHLPLFKCTSRNVFTKDACKKFLEGRVAKVEESNDEIKASAKKTATAATTTIAIPQKPPVASPIAPKPPAETVTTKEEQQTKTPGEPLQTPKLGETTPPQDKVVVVTPTPVQQREIQDADKPGDDLPLSLQNIPETPIASLTATPAPEPEDKEMIASVNNALAEIAGNMVKFKEINQTEQNKKIFYEHVLTAFDKIKLQYDNITKNANLQEPSKEVQQLIESMYAFMNAANAIGLGIDFGNISVTFDSIQLMFSPAANTQKYAEIKQKLEELKSLENGFSKDKAEEFKSKFKAVSLLLREAAKTERALGNVDPSIEFSGIMIKVQQILMFAEENNIDIKFDFDAETAAVAK